MKYVFKKEFIRRLLALKAIKASNGSRFYGIISKKCLI